MQPDYNYILKEYKMFGIGPTEMVIIGMIIFFIFGAKRIPEMMKGMAQRIREFRKVDKEIKSDLS